MHTAKHDATFEIVQSMKTQMDRMEATISRLEGQSSGNYHGTSRLTKQVILQSQAVESVIKWDIMLEDVPRSASCPSLRKTRYPSCQAVEGLVTLTHDNINISQCTHNVADDIILQAIDPTHAYHVTRLANNVPISFMVDTGASVSLIREDIWEKSSRNSAGGLET